MKSIAIILVSILLFAACTSGKYFTSRKYMRGRYVNHSEKPERLNKKCNKRNEIVLATRSDLIHGPTTIGNQSQETEKNTYSPTNVPVNKRNSALIPTLIKNNSSIKGNSISGFSKTITNKTIKKTRRVTAQDPGIERKSLLGFIFGLGGLIIDIAGFIIAVAAMEYIFLSILMLGLILGILGIVYGTQGIKSFNSERKNGNKQTKNLVFGIIGASLGLAAIIAALWFFVYGILIISFGA